MQKVIAETHPEFTVYGKYSYRIRGNRTENLAKTGL